jgi:hypothetical protein
VLEALSHSPRRPPIVFVCDFARPQDTFAAAKLGAFDFVVLNRAEDLDAVVQAVRSALQLARIPRVFLSYASADRAQAARIAESIRQQGWQVWFDDWEIRVGDSIVDKIEDGILRSSYLVLLLSKASVRSRWVKEEINATLMRQLGDHDITLLPVLLEECDIPLLLRSRKYADLRHSFTKGVGLLIEAVRAG